MLSDIGDLIVVRCVLFDRPLIAACRKLVKWALACAMLSDAAPRVRRSVAQASEIPSRVAPLRARTATGWSMPHHRCALGAPWGLVPRSHR